MGVLNSDSDASSGAEQHGGEAAGCMGWGEEGLLFRNLERTPKPGLLTWVPEVPPVTLEHTLGTR